MNESDLTQVEAELRALSPARPPQHVVNRTLAALGSSQRQPAGWNWREALAWLNPAFGIALIAILVLLFPGAWERRGVASLSAARAPLKADQIEINRELLAYYDAVGQLPDGEAIRFHCAHWIDKLSVGDSAAGLKFESSVPRLEIGSAELETY